MFFAVRSFVSALALSVFFPSLLVDAVETRYIDDETGDPLTGLKPRYTPDDQWSSGSTCPGCNLHPNQSLAYNGTWHDTTHKAEDSVGRSVHLTFTGTGLSVFCIIPPSSAAAIINYDLIFTLDGLPAGNGFSLEPNITQYLYNVSVITLSDLPNMQHEFIMEASSTTTDSVVLFDYATYIYDGSLPITSSSPPAGFSFGPSITASSRTDGASSTGSTRNNTGPIVGGVIGGVILLLGVIAAVLLLLRRKSLHQESSYVAPESFVAPHIYTGSERPEQPYTPSVATSSVIRSPTVSTGPASTTGTPTVHLIPQRYLEEKSQSHGPPPAYEE